MAEFGHVLPTKSAILRPPLRDACLVTALADRFAYRPSYRGTYTRERLNEQNFKYMIGVAPSWGDKIKSSVLPSVPESNNTFPRVQPMSGSKPGLRFLKKDMDANMEKLPSDFFVASNQFTKSVYRDVYPAIDPSSEALSQAGKVIIISGASRGIGKKGFALSFAKSKPAGLVLVARSGLADTEALIRTVNKEVTILSIPTDITKPESVAHLFEEIKAKFPHGAQVLINNAGSFRGQNLIPYVDESEWWANFELNVHGTFNITRSFLQQLPHPTHGTIISLTTALGAQAMPAISSYTLTKLVVIQMMACIAAEAAAEQRNVTAVGLDPGMVNTDLMDPKFAKFALDTPELVGGTAVWLCTERAKFLNGRMTKSNWCVDDLVEMQERIVQNGELSIKLSGNFGPDRLSS